MQPGTRIFDAVGPVSIPRGVSRLAAVGFVVLLGAALRIGWNDVTEFSRADEFIYYGSAVTLSADWTSYPAIVHDYIARPDRWPYPLPSRWAGVLITAVACTVGPCTYHTLAWIETIAGIVAIALTYLVARRLFGDTAAWLAAALTAVAPIQLAMGRRALEDELFLVAVLAALLAAVALARAAHPSAWLIAGSIVAFTLAIAVKEVFLLAYPALAALMLKLREDHRPRRTDVALFALPPFAYAAVFSLWSGDPGALVRLAEIWRGIASTPAPYVVDFQSGPVYEPFLDVYVLAPLVTVAAVASIGLALRPAPGRRGALALAAYLAMLFIGYALVPRDARYFMPADAAFRLLAAWGVASLVSPRFAPLAVTLAATLDAVVELPIFAAVFLRGGVYDPVLANLLRALDAIPR